ncbi:hypothetical protein LWI28_028988 [Acer negundo]|uniref:40S ribosomal protein S7 n=1 Tax=Acer negundo TaxID=4023 RepID=A0AAD5NZL9_ACENE|nr:hypothetical protein LWI28_028988 [Acer negundo]
MGLAEIVVVVIIVGSVRDWAMAAAIPSTAPAHVVALSLDKLSSDLWSSDLRVLLYAKMYSSKKKIQKDHDAEPTEFEETVAQALFDLGNTNQELKSDLKDLYINQAMYDSMAWLLC